MGSLGALLLAVGYGADYCARRPASLRRLIGCSLLASRSMRSPLAAVTRSRGA